MEFKWKCCSISQSAQIGFRYKWFFIILAGERFESRWVLFANLFIIESFRTWITLFYNVFVLGSRRIVLLVVIALPFGRRGYDFGDIYRAHFACCWNYLNRIAALSPYFPLSVYGLLNRFDCTLAVLRVLLFPAVDLAQLPVTEILFYLQGQLFGLPCLFYYELLRQFEVYCLELLLVFDRRQLHYLLLLVLDSWLLNWIVVGIIVRFLLNWVLLLLLLHTYDSSCLIVLFNYFLMRRQLGLRLNHRTYLGLIYLAGLEDRGHALILLRLKCRL